MASAIVSAPRGRSHRTPAPLRPRRRSVRRAGAVLTPLLLVFALTSCGGGGSKDAAGGTDTTLAPVVAGSSPATVIAQPTVANTAAVADTSASASEATATTFRSAIIPTPSDVLNGTVASTAPAAATDGDLTITPPDFAIAARAIPPAVKVYRDRAGAATVTTIDNPLPSGAPLTFLVDAQTPQRAKVLLPIRPNGSIGWVDLSDVRLERVDFRVRVELTAHRLEVLNAGTVSYTFPIGVGKATTPTPDGRYYIKELLRPPDPKGAYGPFAYGLSGFSDAVPNYNGGDGVLGIHGTNEPDKVGTDVSHGCIRLRNDDITKLAAILPLGTPVEVIA